MHEKLLKIGVLMETENSYHLPERKEVSKREKPWFSPGKGQIFLIISVLILLALILLKMQTSSTPENLRFYTSLELKDTYENLQNEYEKAAEISLFQKKTPQNLEQNLNNFSSYAINKLGQKNYTLKTLYTFAFANSSLNITVGNFLGETIRSISLNISDGQNDFISSIANKQSVSKNFSLPNSFNITVTYFLAGQKNFTYYSDSGKIAAYFDIYLRQADSYLDEKLIFNKTLYDY